MTRSRFSQFAWGLLIYNLAVVIWGVFVRASFSGDGCGAHWPLCGGQVVPTTGRITTLIEFGHRASTGLVLLLVCAEWLFARRLFPQGHPVRRGAGLSVLFTLSEALIGAALVLYKLVSHNTSVYRAVAISSHLTNTFILLACLSLTAWWSSGGLPAFGLPSPGQGRVKAALGIGLLGALVLGITGTIAALGDTLFPSESILAGMKQDFAPTANYLLRLRPFHPMVAIVVGVYLAMLALWIMRRRPSQDTRLFGRILIGLFLLQMGIGFVNLMLHAPVSMQLEHLFVADMLWIDLVLLSAAALAVEPTEVRLPSPQEGYAGA